MDQTRRKFFFMTTAAAAVAAPKLIAANDKVNVAVVGLGGRGQAHMAGYMNIPGANIVALCDVNQAALETAQAKVLKATGKQPKGYKNMKEVFADKEVDAVSMPLPNHWHALATVWACQAGKDVYIEKPACHNYFEGQQMINAARKYNRMVQIGSQSRSMTHKMKAMQLLREGVIGNVYMAKGLCYKRRPSIGHKADAPVPAGLDWDSFLGPAPMRPYNELRFKYNWHWFWDTGNGDMGNQGIHEMDIARWGLGVEGLPKYIQSFGGKFVYNDDQETPNVLTNNYHYGDKQIVFETRGLLTNGEGGVQIRGGNAKQAGNAIGDLFYGSEGWMSVDGAGFQVYKGESNEKVMDEKHDALRDTEPHMENFLAGVRSRNYKDLHADVAIGVQSANLVHLGNIAYRLNRRLEWDDKAHKFVNDAEANKMLTRDYRKPYVVPEIKI